MSAETTFDAAPASSAEPTTGASPRQRLRRAPPPALSDKLRRMIWAFVQATAYRWSPTPAHGWRCSILRLFGATVGPGAHPYPSATVSSPWNLVMEARSCLGPGAICYSVGAVRLGEDAIVSQGAHLCSATHDHRDPDFTLMIGDIEIEAEAWVAADAFVAPGVRIGRRAVLGARAVAVKDIAAGDVAVGNPAKPVARRDDD